jgi:hypothetical protein
MTDKKIKYDENLWFEHDGCEGKHYLLGNPHTFPGRIWAYCTKKDTTFCVSKNEIGNMSIQSEYWIKGFLIGNQPIPPTDTNDEVNYESKEYKNWVDKVEIFNKNGIWE